MRVADALSSETGLRPAFHHHFGGFVEAKNELARFLELTDDSIGLVFDTGHYAFSYRDCGNPKSIVLVPG